MQEDIDRFCTYSIHLGHSDPGPLMLWNGFSMIPDHIYMP